jgi:hypothetical protein
MEGTEREFCNDENIELANEKRKKRTFEAYIGNMSEKKHDGQTV